MGLIQLCAPIKANSKLDQVPQGCVQHKSISHTEVCAASVGPPVPWGRIFFHTSTQGLPLLQPVLIAFHSVPLGQTWTPSVL